MAGLRFLNGVDRQRANGVDRKLINILVRFHRRGLPAFANVRVALRGLPAADLE
jgi:hypothetical protein